MFLAALTLMFTLFPCSAPQKTESPDPAKNLHAWAKKYEAGEIEVAEKTTRGTISSTLYRGFVEKRQIGRISHHAGLTRLLTAARKHQDLDTVRALLKLATVGLRRTDVGVLRRPEVVRSSAVSTLGRFGETKAQFMLMKFAQGDKADWRGRWSCAVQAAALRALGVSAIKVARPLLERSLRHDEPTVRLAAAEALHATGPPRALDRLCSALDQERDPLVAEQLARTIHAILRRHGEKCEVRMIRRCVLASAGLIGRLSDWRVDRAAVELLADYRSVASIEPLIRILERFAGEEGAKRVDAGLVSGVLRHRAHEVLQSLTGARFAAHDSARWRAFWEKVREDFVLAKAPPKTAHTSSGFFGIPIVGSRVAFVIDRSGSMNEEHEEARDREHREMVTRFQWARNELLSAASKLAPDTRFNVVTFSSDVKRWRDKFCEPTKNNLVALRDLLKRTRVEGGTNIFDALDLALGLRTSKSAQRYETPVDEIFLLSDGAPTMGSIVDTESILAVLRDANSQRRVRINTIYIGPEASSGFMKHLAEQNDGQFVRL